MTGFDQSETTATPDPIAEELTVLTRSKTRIDLLEMATRKQPKSQREFRDELPVNRTTVQRNLDVLVDHGWLSETADGYIQTSAGSLLADHLSSLLSMIGTIQRLEPILKDVSLAELDIEIQQLADADITVATTTNPYAPVNKHVTALEEAQEFRISTGVVGRDAMVQVRDRVTDGNLRGEIVLTEAALTTVESDSSYVDLFADIVENDRVDAFVYHGDLPFYLGIIDETVQIGIQDERGRPKALLESKAVSVREWAEGKYQTYTAEATVPDLPKTQ